MEVEVMPPDQQQPREDIRIAHVRALGLVGTLLAILTMAAAFSVGFLVFFGTPLLAAALVALSWPRLFSPEFTQWVFGTPQVEFWKLFVIFLLLGAVAKLLRIRK